SSARDWSPDVCSSDLYAATPNPAASTASRPHDSSPGSTCHACTTRHRPPRHTIRPHGPAYSRRILTSEGTHAGSTEDTTGLQTEKKRGSAEPATPPHSPSPHQPSKPPPGACGQPRTSHSNPTSTHSGVAPNAPQRMTSSTGLSRPVRNLSGAPTIRHLAPRTRTGHASGTPATVNASPSTCTTTPKATMPATTSGPTPNPNTPIDNNSAAPLASAHPNRRPRQHAARPRTANENKTHTTRARAGHHSPATATTAPHTTAAGTVCDRCRWTPAPSRPPRSHGVVVARHTADERARTPR